MMMKKRITDAIYHEIFNSPKEIENINKIGFDLMIDLFGEIKEDFEDYLGKGIAIDIDNKGEVVISSLFNYLFKIMNTYMMFISGSHKIGALILGRTISEIDIKIRYLLAKSDEEVYTNYINSSLIAEKFYLNELKGMMAFEKEFIDGTKKSIFELLDHSGVDNVDTLTRKNSPFPSIEKMAKFLVEEDIITNAHYNIIYRNYSNYSHANWSAVENEMFRNKNQNVDLRLIAPISILIIELILYSSQKLNMISDSLVDSLKIHTEAFITLDKAYIEKYWVDNV